MEPELYVERDGRQFPALVSRPVLSARRERSGDMKPLAFQEPVRAILLDIEGTTTPIDFVYQTLFPYARARLAAYLERRAGEPDLQADLRLLRADHSKELAGGFEPPPYD